jgi:hypothetical protein
MKSWIITGGIACGKSSVMRAFERNVSSFVRFYSADEVAQRLLDQPVVMEALHLLFGDKALVTCEDGQQKTDRTWILPYLQVASVPIHILLISPAYYSFGARDPLTGLLSIVCPFIFHSPFNYQLFAC